MYSTVFCCYQSAAQARDLSERAAERAEAQRLDLQRRREAFLPTPSLEDAVSILLDEYYDPLTSTSTSTSSSSSSARGDNHGICGLCGKRLLPGKPEWMSKVPKKMRVEVLPCGHFFHWACLNHQLEEPPFGRDGCRRCGGVIQHPRLMTNDKLLEQNWAAKQAKAREQDDVLDCFM